VTFPPPPLVSVLLNLALYLSPDFYTALCAPCQESVGTLWCAAVRCWHTVLKHNPCSAVLGSLLPQRTLPRGHRVQCLSPRVAVCLGSRSRAP
jgi:hypothetical protein